LEKLKTDIPNSPFDNTQKDVIQKEQDWEAKRELKVNNWIHSFVTAEIFNNEKDLKLTNYFKHLSRKQQHDLVSKTFHDWYDTEVNNKINNLYSEKLVDNTLKGDILKEWDLYIQSNLNSLVRSVFNLT
tara:strand:- start:39 stop:425 length:387 start_codon:yes stop_codon:yes gene_type:complete